MKKILTQLYTHQPLSRKEAENLIIQMALNSHEETLISAILSAYNMRKPTLEELKGFRDAMLELCIRIDLGSANIMDICGTGGDEKNTFNISTICSFILAGADIPVAKHGNYGVSSISGSSTVLEQLGITFSESEYALLKQLEKSNICFLHAPVFNPSMKAVAKIRNKLGVKTFFNMLGPLCNPAQPKVQLTGVYDLELLRLYHYLFQDDQKQFTLIHNLDGYDEISLTDDVKIITNEGERIYTKNELSQLSISPHDITSGQSIKESTKIFMNILNGDGTAEQNEVVIINSAFAIKTYYPTLSIQDAKSIAENSLFNHKALNKFSLLKSFK